MLCIRKGVENGYVVVCEKTNEQCELRDSMRHDELGDMGHYVPMKKRYIKSTITNRPLSKHCLLFHDNHKPTKPTRQN
jgi:hypothetical protein